MIKVKKKIGLVPKLIIAIILGIIIGSFAPKGVIEVLVTISGLFASFLQFVIPFIILGFVTAGVADLTSGAGKLLGITTGIAYCSTIIAGLLAYVVAITIFPTFINANIVGAVDNPNASMLSPIFTMPLEPMLDVTAAIVFAFMMGLGISALRGQGRGEGLFNIAMDFQEIIKLTLSKVIIPLLPIYIAGTFANITFTGQVWDILKIFGKVYLIVIPLHIIYICFQFTIAGIYSKKSPIQLLKNQIPGYLTAVGTQSSAATIPVNVECAEKNGVSKQIREFVVPLCATIHLAGSIISVTSFTVAVLMMNQMNYSLSVMLPYLLMLGVAMVAAPGAPGGAIMSALPFLPMVGIPSDGGLASLMIALYITQDSFGTAANISGDNAIAVVIDQINDKSIKKVKA